MSAWLVFVFLFSVPLSWVAAIGLGWLYQRRMEKLAGETGGTPPSAAVDVALLSAPSREDGPTQGTAFDTPASATIIGFRRAHARVRRDIVLLSLAMAAAMTAVRILDANGTLAVPPMQWIVVTALQMWVVVPLLGAVYRWPLAVVGWMAALAIGLFLVLRWRVDASVPSLSVLALMVQTLSVPMLVISGLMLFAGIRAITPWLWPFVALGVASIFPAFALLNAALGNLDGDSWLGRMAESLGAVGTLAVLLVLVPAIVALGVAWPATRTLARGFAAGRVTETTLFAAELWAISAVVYAAGTWSAGRPSSGWLALTYFAPLLLIPAYVGWRRRNPQLTSAGRAPHLLMLRRFRESRDLEQLFDDVTTRWRDMGPVSVIAGKYLIRRTIQADELLTYFHGGLQQRLIRTDADVDSRLRFVPARPDPEGRFRIHGFYCRNDTWQKAVEPLIGRSDAVLMDLRGFTAANGGCAWELQKLTASPRELRVVIVFDRTTDKAAAEEAVQRAPTGRVRWVDAGGKGRRQVRDEVLGALLA